MTRLLAWPRSPPGAHCIVKAPPAVRLRGAACVCAELGRQVVEVVRGLARVAPVRAALFTGGHPFSTHRRMLDEVRGPPALADAAPPLASGCSSRGDWGWVEAGAG